MAFDRVVDITDRLFPENLQGLLKN